MKKAPRRPEAAAAPDMRSEYRLDYSKARPNRFAGRVPADTVAAGSFVVSTNQRLGMLAAFLLEPGSEDGYAAWNFFDAGIKQGGFAPVKRLAKLPVVKMVTVP